MLGSQDQAPRTTQAVSDPGLPYVLMVHLAVV